MRKSCYIEQNSIIRIISARKATKQKVKQYRSFSPMKDQYDCSKSVQNPYFKKLKKQLKIRIEEEVVDYFRTLSEEAGIPYQTLINLYLQDCMRSQKKLSLEWIKTV